MSRRIRFFGWSLYIILAMLGGLGSSPYAFALTRYVSLDGSNTSPYTNWEMAASSIQAAVDESLDGDVVWVTNGLYAVGQTVTPEAALMNRVCVTNAVIIQSVNGPEVSLIQGAESSDGGCGDDAVRCVYLAHGAQLIGFTLTNGFTRTDEDWRLNQSGAGALINDADSVLSNCILTGNTAYDSGGGVEGGRLEDCVLTANRAWYGGGADSAELEGCFINANYAEGSGGGTYAGVLRNCVLGDNVSDGDGGGTDSGVLEDCTLRGNIAAGMGGDAMAATLTHCQLSDNIASNGGGAGVCVLSNCVLRGNTAMYGGGASGGEAHGSFFSANSAWQGGGAYEGSVVHCTFVGNSANERGGGMYQGQGVNSILYANTACVAANYYNSFLEYCCSVPLASGLGNMDEDPSLADLSHLASDSPCIGMGASTLMAGTDIDGDPWSEPPSMGCDEYMEGSATGTLTVALIAPHGAIVEGYELDFRLEALGHALSNLWSFGDGTFASNTIVTSHAWTEAGTYEVTITVYNLDHPEGVQDTLSIQVEPSEASISYVWLDSPHPTPPYADWDTAAHTIQEAVDACLLPGSRVIVTNGLYNEGVTLTPNASLSNRVCATNGVIIESVNGPEVTIIEGAESSAGGCGEEAVRCIYLENHSRLIGFTLTHGYTRAEGYEFLDQSGGGALLFSEAQLSNCVLVGNGAFLYGGGTFMGDLDHCSLGGNSAEFGGGASDARLQHCLLDENLARLDGGGAYHSILAGCTLSKNTADTGGGVGDSYLTSCALYTNSAQYGGGSSHDQLVACSLIGNSASAHGGGSYGSSLSQCWLEGNTANRGGGAFQGRLDVCTLLRNEGFIYGGGAANASLDNCQVRENSAAQGGGAYECNLNRCGLVDNSASDQGGGAWSGTLSNSLVRGNTAVNGGGVRWSVLVNCTVMGNVAYATGGGAYGGAAYNCILYGNQAASASSSNHSSVISVHSCLSPLDSGTGNMDLNPRLADSYHLFEDSPCRGAGSSDYVGNMDMDGDPWEVPPSIGCDEYVARSGTGSLTVAVSSPFTTLVAGYSLTLNLSVVGHALSNRWSFGDGAFATNVLDPSHAWENAGQYDVTVTVYNLDHPTGVVSSLSISILDEGASSLHVWTHSPAPASPYSTWETAAHTIQDAIEAARWPGCIVLVTNGVYEVGGVMTPEAGLTNRVCATNRVTIRSVNGAGVTTIRGSAASGGPHGCSAVRCVYLGDGTLLDGFTLSSGHTCTNGDPVADRSGGGALLVGNARMSHCVLSGNSAFREGGGVYGGTLTDCMLTSNSAASGGGGANHSALTSCTLTRNSASLGGGGAYCTLVSSLVQENSAGSAGGGVYDSDASHCTIIGNSAQMGGGSSLGTMNSCIVYGNAASIAQRNNFYGGTFRSSCTDPLAFGSGNISANPQMVDSAHISATSPCRGAGWPNSVSGFDIDGDSWTIPPSMGCDEYVARSATGVLAVSISAPFSTVAVDFALNIEAHITGHALSNRWSFGDGTITNNTLSLAHAWMSNGTYEITVTAYNLSHPEGEIGRLSLHVVDRETSTAYVWTNSPNPLPPFTNWTTAAHTIQEAVDVCVPGGWVFVTNGVYNQGGLAVPGATLTNRLVVTNSVTIRSVNGPGSTRIEGASTVAGGVTNRIRCVYLAQEARLVGFTLTNGYGGAFLVDDSSLSNCWIHGNSGASGVFGGTLYNCDVAGNAADLGAGVYESTLYACSIRRNSATGAHGMGGGSYQSTLYNCLLEGNSATEVGGGSTWSKLYNCTVVGNSSEGFAGGSAWDTMQNCIVYGNFASLSSDSNYYMGGSGEIRYTCTAPLTNALGNIDADPLFVDAQNGDYRLRADSPCIDRGRTEPWVSGTTDLDGYARVFRGIVDQGAYEFHFNAGLKMFLQGPYDTNSHVMSLSLSTNIPLTSPYADDPRTVPTIPSNAVDWVLVQARASLNSAPIFSRSMFVRSDGWIITETGDTNLNVEVAPLTTNYICVAHRNHPLALSAQPLIFTNQTFCYDFTTGLSQYSGGTNGAVELESGVCGLWAGDTDADGRITSVDQAIAGAQVGQSGYKCGDYDLDGLVTLEHDVQRFFPTNLRCQSAAPNSELALSPNLTVSPARKTTLVEATVELSAFGTTNACTWFLVENPSGGSISLPPATSILYQAGTTSSCVDVVEVWDGEYKFGRSYMNVISAEDMALAGKAVIIAGRVSDNDVLWPATAYLANNGYNTLSYRGFSDDNIRYLSPVTHLQPVDAENTYTNVEMTFTNWINTADKLFVYLVDHGRNNSGKSSFRLNSSESLPAEDLDVWLDHFQNTYQREVTIVIDCCYAASLMNELSYTGAAKRIILAAAGTNEPAYFIAGGLISFSDAFFSGILSGQDLDHAYQMAQGAMAPYQQSGYIDNVGGGAASSYYLGATFISGKDAPQIGLACGDQLLDWTSEAFLWASDVVSAYQLEKVWCMIIPPTHLATNPAAPITDIPEVPLPYSSTAGRYQGAYNGFSAQGTYKVLYYAKDIWGSVSPPRQSYVMQNGYDEKVILVASGNTNGVNGSAINHLGHYAYSTLKKRGLGPQRLYYLNSDLNQQIEGTNVVNDLPTLAALHQAITNWAVGADALTVYLVGEGTNNTLILNPAETLDGLTLGGWLTEFQGTSRVARVVMDFAGAGAFIPALTPPLGRERISIASCRASRECVQEAGGMLSFSRFFFSEVKAGRHLQDAFLRAQYSIRRASGALRQSALIDDNGNGIANEKNVDGMLSRNRYLGPAFVTGAESPSIGSVTPDTELTNASSCTLWAADAVDAQGISNVWCLITPPNYGWASHAVETNLTWNASQSRYEISHAGFSLTGTYVCTYYAANLSGEVSAPQQTLVRVRRSEGLGLDAYEPDNDRLQASDFPVGEGQIHTLHTATDEDWTFFYAVGDLLYDVETVHLTNQIDTILELYSMDSDGALHLVDRVDEFGYDQGELMGLDHPAEGLYFVRVTSTNYLEPGAYRLTIAPCPFGGVGDTLLVVAANFLDAQALPAGLGVKAQISAFDHSIEMPFATNNHVFFANDLQDTLYTVILAGVPAEGWAYVRYSSAQSVSFPVNATPDFRQVTFYLQPIHHVSGALRDAWTGEWLPDAMVNLHASHSIYAGLDWTNFTQADGTFFSSQAVAAIDWIFTLSKSGYSNRVFTLPGSSWPAGTFTNLGGCRLMPIATQGNGLSDAWILRYFGPGTNVSAQADADGDGQSNLEEYYLGTDPTNEASFLQVSSFRSPVSDGVLRWPVAIGRSYSVYQTEDLLDPVWELCFGPQTASNAQTSMQWTFDGNAQPNACYQIRLNSP